MRPRSTIAFPHELRELFDRRQQVAIHYNRRWLLGLFESDSGLDEAGQAAQASLRLQRVEAILFLAREPLNARKLAQFADLEDGTEARTLVRRLNSQYTEGGYAFRVEDVAGGFQLLTRPQFAPWLRRLGHVPPETRLSTPAMETLSVVAYRQPVLRVDIEAIRGVSCGEILRQLMERELVRIAGRSEELGRPYLYGTTKRFLQTFGLKSLDSLPRAEAMRQPVAMAEPVDEAEEFDEHVDVTQSDSPQDEENQSDCHNDDDAAT
jgi:segregation and condensation protein B